MAFFYDGISLQNGRRVNMDSLLLNVRSVGGGTLCLAAVCDGVGSLADGAFAAASAVRMLRNWFENLEDAESLGHRLREYAASMNLGIAARARTRGLDTACTLSCLLLWEGGYCVVHAGDSRIYLWEEGRLRQLTRDHSREGRLTSALGRWPETEIFYAEGPRQPGQRFLLCSDGLYKRMDADVLAGAMGRLNHRELESVLRHLAEYVIARGERDNISAALVMNDER